MGTVESRLKGQDKDGIIPGNYPHTGLGNHDAKSIQKVNNKYFRF